MHRFYWPNTKTVNTDNSDIRPTENKTLSLSSTSVAYFYKTSQGQKQIYKIHLESQFSQNKNLEEEKGTNWEIHSPWLDLSLQHV